MVILFVAAVGCAPEETALSGHLVVACSDSALPLVQREIQAFTTLYPSARIEVAATDSRGALAGLFEGRAGVAVISRDLEEEERQAARSAGYDLETHRIAVDGIAFVVHPDNPVDSLTLAQVAGLLMGVTTSWQSIGGQDRTVVPVLRDRNSGTYETVRQEVLSGAGFAVGVVCRTSQEVVDQVAAARGGIGCVGLAWLSGGRVKPLRVARDAGGGFVGATAREVYGNRYPVRRPILVCRRHAVKADLQAGFVAFLTSTRGQVVVESEGLVPDTVPERIIQLN